MTRAKAKYFADDFVQATPTGTVNGSNTVFTLPSTPAEDDQVQVWVNGLFQLYAVDFTVSGTTVTMTTAPATESNIRVAYWKQ